MTRKHFRLYPTAGLAGLFFVLAAMWYAAASQNNAAAYLLLFGLTSVFLVSLPRTLLNLANLEVATESVKPAFAGQEISVPVEIVNESPRATRRGLKIGLANVPATELPLDLIAAGQGARVTLRLPVEKRGEYEIGGLRLMSTFPLGFFRSCKTFSAGQRYLVYPKPAGDSSFPHSRGARPEGISQAETGEGDDFSGVRAYIPGESQRHIDWKAVARGQALMTKQFSVEREDDLFLDFSMAGAGDLEARLSQLSLWIIEAERSHRSYGLRLPGTEIPPSTGDSHFHRCLRALALFA